MRALRAAVERVARAVDDVTYYTKDVPPPVYIRCSECGRIGVQGYRRGGIRDEPAARNKVKAPMPPEYRCRWCQEFSPRVLGDEIDLDDPTVDVVDMLCLAPHRLPVLRWFRSCHTIYPAPAEAHTLTTCPCCGVYAVAQTTLEAYNRSTEPGQ
ncbi:hypothetical protein ACFVWG_14010 [Kribbella sp. NPDC058245]|uniref:hypothetical protein n=1 Tax=Kribbella sp. NPDC058245 TaxID=3346399 RepID=UPI0036E40FFD